MHWTFDKGKRFLTGFEFGALALQALGIGLQVGAGPPEQRETEMERAIKRRSALMSAIRREREKDQRRSTAGTVVRLLDGVRMGNTLADDAIARREMLRSANNGS